MELLPHLIVFDGLHLCITPHRVYNHKGAKTGSANTYIYYNPTTELFYDSACLGYSVLPCDHAHCGNTESTKPLTTSNKSAVQTDVMTSQEMGSKIRKTLCYLTSQTQHRQSSLSKSSVFVMHALNVGANAAVSKMVCLCLICANTHTYMH